jgi:hypothetical protein
MKTLKYLCENVRTLEDTHVEIPIEEAIKNPIGYQVGEHMYHLLSSDTTAYLIHRYAPVLACSVNPSIGLDKTYVELYAESPEALISLIQDNKLEDNLNADIRDMYAMYEKLEIQVKQLDDYQNGRLDY